MSGSTNIEPWTRPPAPGAPALGLVLAPPPAPYTSNVTLSTPEGTVHVSSPLIGQLTVNIGAPPVGGSQDVEACAAAGPSAGDHRKRQGETETAQPRQAGRG